MSTQPERDATGPVAKRPPDRRGLAPDFGGNFAQSRGINIDTIIPRKMEVHFSRGAARIDHGAQGNLPTIMARVSFAIKLRRQQGESVKRAGGGQRTKTGERARRLPVAAQIYGGVKRQGLTQRLGQRQPPERAAFPGHG